MSRRDVDLMQAAIQLAVLGALRGTVRGVQVAGEHVLGESRKIVPIEEGTLERSGRVTYEMQGDHVVAAVSYGGGVGVSVGGGQHAVGADKYAERQHEDMTLRHDAGRSAKYLEIPLNREKATVARIVAESTRAGMQENLGRFESTVSGAMR